MIPQFDHQVTSSFLLWFNHTLLDKGKAYTNYSSQLFDISDEYSNYYTYAAPFKGFVSDSSITGSNVISGVYDGNYFYHRGSGILEDINYDEGQVYFSSQPSGLVSGDYSVPDFNVRLTDEAEETLLFEKKYYIVPRSMYQNPTSGLNPDIETAPIVFILDKNSDNIPFALGGMDKTEYEFRAVIIADNKFMVDGACSIFRDRVRTHIPLFSELEMPFNGWGGLTGQYYNYTGMAATKNASEGMFIDDVRVSKMYQTSAAKLNPNIKSALIDFYITKPRFPHN